MKWNNDDKKLLTVAWFSAGVSSAVATKMMIDEVDIIIYTNIKDHHEDAERYKNDCQDWFDKEITVIQSDKYESIRDVFRKERFINSPFGAPCTKHLKRKVREKWEAEHEEYHLRYVWGMDSTEAHRVPRILQAMPAQEHIFPLIEKGINKTAAHKISKASGIKRPCMYDLGYSNDNCKGCVKGGKGYWNKIRVDFPSVFEETADIERELDHSILKDVFLDELPPGAGRDQGPIVEDCGLYCQMMAI